MRLDDFDPNINVEDQRGQGGGGFGFGGGGGGGGGLLFSLLPMIGSRFGCAGIAVVLLIFGAITFMGGGLTGGGSAPTATSRAHGTDVRSSCTLNAESRTACTAFSSADHTWAALFQQQGRQFTAPKLVFYDRNGQSGCGAAQSAMGPFYCPTDQGIYLDTSFFGELTNRFHASGDFAQDYVIAHEFGHHIQNLLGASDRVHNIQRSGSETEGNHASVLLELQADCYAGVWAAQNRDRMDQGDVQEGMDRGARHRRRHPAAGGAGARRPRQLHPRHVGGADALAADRAQLGRPGAVRYLRQGRRRLSAETTAARS